MRYKILAPSYMYYLILIQQTAGVIFLSTVFVKSLRISEIFLTVVLGSLAIALFLYTIFFSGRFIFAKVDLHKNELLYGNAFLNKQINIKHVKYIGTYFLSGKIIRVEINGRKYSMHCLERGMEIYLKGDGK